MSTRTTVSAVAAFLCVTLLAAPNAKAAAGLTATDTVPVSGSVVDACSVDMASDSLTVTCTNSSGEEDDKDNPGNKSSSEDELLTESDEINNTVAVTMDTETVYDAEGFDSFSDTYSPGIVEENSLQNKNCVNKKDKQHPVDVTLSW